MVLNNFQNAKNCYYLQTKQREIDRREGIKNCYIHKNKFLNFLTSERYRKANYSSSSSQA